MKTVVVFKWSKDPQDARVNATGEVNWGGVKLSPSDDDPAAAEVARALAPEEEIVAVTVGDGDLAWAAARGAGSTLVVEDVRESPDGMMVGGALAAAIEKSGNVDTVVIGDSEWEYSVVSALIAHLGWNAVAGVTAAEADGDALRVTQKAGSSSNILRVEKPAILAAKALHSEKDVPGMKQTLAARKKPVEKLASADLGVATSSEAATAEATHLPSSTSAVMIDGSDPVAAVEQLLVALRNEDVL